LIEVFERKNNAATAEHNEVHKALKECRKAKMRLEEKNDLLQKQLDHLSDEICSTKSSMVCKDLLVQEKSRVVELQNTLNEQRRESKERESDLRASIKRMQRDNNDLRENSFSQETLIESLEKKLRTAKSDWKRKESDLRSRHDLEMKEATQASEKETLSLRNAMEFERKICIT
jgi:chromosome segregation ATPase